MDVDPADARGPRPGHPGRDLVAVRDALQRPHEGYLMYGFEDLRVGSASLDSGGRRRHAR